jgi:hypothetical protein
VIYVFKVIDWTVPAPNNPGRRTLFIGADTEAEARERLRTEVGAAFEHCHVDGPLPYEPGRAIDTRR